MPNKRTFASAIALTAVFGVAAIIGNALIANCVLQSWVTDPPQVLAVKDGPYDNADESLILMRGIENGGTVIMEYSGGSQPTAILTETAEDGQSEVRRYEGEAALELLHEWRQVTHESENPMVETEPGMKTIPLEEAIQIARDGVIRKYDLKPNMLTRFTITSKHMTDGDRTFWWILYYPTDTVDFLEIGCYSVLINSEDGNIESVMTAADGRG